MSQAMTIWTRLNVARVSGIITARHNRLFPGFLLASLTEDLDFTQVQTRLPPFGLKFPSRAGHDPTDDRRKDWRSCSTVLVV